MARLEQRLGFTRYDADESYKRALDAYKKGDFDAAIDSMNAAIDALPRHPEYYAARGFLFAEDGEEAKAKADYETALKLYKYEMLAHYGLGMIAYKAAQKGDDTALWQTALQHFITAYRIDPHRPETQYYLALVYYNCRDYPNAVKYMLQAQAAFDQAGDRRKTNADKWVREFSRWVERTRALLAAADTPPTLPE
ncbi:MAG: tetratricopeptide repeat protein [bacterium]|nr:tetratricopeptide repeat protein [bacterium]